MTFKVIPMEPRTFSWWRDEKDDIDLDPVYQRKGHIWSKEQKQYLIDSILNGFDVPKLYVADFTFLNSNLNQIKKKYAVIDGKQRLMTIYDFFDDLVSLPRGFIYTDDPALQLGGFTYSDLQKNYPKIARKFDNSSFTVMSVITDDESKINELFVRLNSSKPLSGAEIRNAVVGRLPGIIRDLTDHPFFKRRIKFSTTRSQDKNLAAKLLLLEHRGSIVDTKKNQLDALVDEANETKDASATAEVQIENTEIGQALTQSADETENPDVARSAERMVAILDRMVEIFVDEDDLLRQQSQIVVNYWLVRETAPDSDSRIRPFLLYFEEQRRSNKADEQKDPEIDEYELLARTSNDAYSIRRRDQIIKKRFAEFLGSGGRHS